MIQVIDSLFCLMKEFWESKVGYGWILKWVLVAVYLLF
jgi:hypothetical protein